jgi:hypothetical protein
MTKRSICTLSALAAASLLGGQAFAGTTTEAKTSKTVVEPAKENWISGDIGIDVVSKYFFHGINQENQGAILQPYADISFKLLENRGALTSLSADIGIWNSFHSHRGTASTTNNWYEFDFTTGLTATIAERWTVSAKYIAYLSPGDYFGSSYAVGLRVGYDDKDLLGQFSLQPYVYVEAEVDGKSANGKDEGFYYEVGINPNHSWGDLNVALPIKAGFGSNDYYAHDEGYGFFSAGLALTYSLTFVPEKWGSWSLSAGATYYNLGDGVKKANNGDENDVVFNGGLKVAF